MFLKNIFNTKIDLQISYFLTQKNNTFNEAAMSLPLSTRNYCNRGIQAMTNSPSVPLGG